MKTFMMWLWWVRLLMTMMMSLTTMMAMMITKTIIMTWPMVSDHDGEHDENYEDDKLTNWQWSMNYLIIKVKEVKIAKRKSQVWPCFMAHCSLHIFTSVLSFCRYQWSCCTDLCIAHCARLLNKGKQSCLKPGIKLGCCMNISHNFRHTFISKGIVYPEQKAFSYPTTESHPVRVNFLSSYSVKPEHLISPHLHYCLGVFLVCNTKPEIT